MHYTLHLQGASLRRFDIKRFRPARFGINFSTEAALSKGGMLNETKAGLAAGKRQSLVVVRGPMPVMEKYLAQGNCSRRPTWPTIIDDRVLAMVGMNIALEVRHANAEHAARLKHSVALDK